ncbi:MAG TPA: NADH-ubiquinone oxidoreductase-F iron-sulfur binding region domain-containing protein [Chloroflexota bacterium]|nr:NADH-ubiquinone oxidoreductase-F iron-sulfur binding region domain-containing protein [Chloroflexota bacterium]
MSTAMVAAPALPRLLTANQRPESLNEHLQHVGPPPTSRSEADRWELIATLERSGLRGRGGAGFPVGTKWRSVATQARMAGGKAVVLANAAEGEPASAKDRVLLARRPHLVLDGALLGAQAIGAAEVVVYVCRGMVETRRTVESAIHERRAARLKEPRVRIALAPDRYVAGEESAAVHRINGGDAKPTFLQFRPFERGIHGAPTLVQNVESLAHAALIARFGDDWFRETGRESSPGTCLLTVHDTIHQPRVHEVEFGSTIGEVLRASGPAPDPQAVLLGGYFGAWLPWAKAENLVLDYAALRAAQVSLGCGVLLALPVDRCGLAEGARIFSYLARETAGQCGPCVYGLRAVADVFWRLAFGRVRASDVSQIESWAQQIVARGACRHPDGAIGMLRSCLTTFAGEIRDHLQRGPCPAALHAQPVAPIPGPEEGWR